MNSTDIYSVEWLIEMIRGLPSDDPVPARQQGYNNYSTQKEHWLGWLNVNSTTGSFRRRSGNERGARYVYNQIGEPKMLIWLASSAGISNERLSAAIQAADDVTNLRSKCGAIRRALPWNEVASALLRSESIIKTGG